MRAEAGQPMLAGHAADIPLPDAGVDTVWISTVIHHIPDLPAAAGEIHRILRPGGRVLIRSVFRGRHHGVTLFRYFPQAVAALDRYPRVTDVQDAFNSFTTTALD